MISKEQDFHNKIKGMLEQDWGIDVYLYEQAKEIAKKNNYQGVLDFLEHDVECKYGRCYLAPSSNG